MPEKDCWKINGNKLTRFHFARRRGLFSPDLIDCPVALSKIAKSRNTVIFPVGGVDLINDEDEWCNVRRHNKKTSFKWIGQTEFTILPTSPTSDEASGPLPEFPAMPTTVDGSLEHRENNTFDYPDTVEEITELMAMIARPAGRKELLSNPKAQASLDVEREKLMKKKAWDMASVREWEDVSREAKKKGKKAHVGEVFEICVETGSEFYLPMTPCRSLREGRYFRETTRVMKIQIPRCSLSLGRALPRLKQERLLMLIVTLLEMSVSRPDGKQAYNQTTLKGAETWVRLPRDRWPQEWVGKYK